MIRTLLRRLLHAASVLFGVALVIFIILRIVPGSPAAAVMGEQADTAAIERMTEELGLKQPVYIQFLRYITGAIRGNFGTSYTLGLPVARLMGAAFGNTLKLVIFAALFAWIFGILCGVISAVTKNSLPDHLFTGLSLLGISVPVFTAAMVLQYVFAHHLNLLPDSGTESLAGYILPAIAIGWGSAGRVCMLVRSSLADVLQENYILTARAKGRGRLSVFVLCALRNALTPLIAMTGRQLAGLLSGAVIAEVLFSINGIGRLAVHAVLGKDIPLLQGIVLLAAAVVVLGDLLADSLHEVLDPGTGKGGLKHV